MTAVLLSEAARLSAQVSGDCNGDGAVTVTELLAGLNVQRGRLPRQACPFVSANIASPSLEDNQALRRALLGGAPANVNDPSGLTAPPASVVIEIGSATGRPGQQATFGVTIRTNGHQIAGIQNDLAFDALTPVAATPGGTPDCTPQSVLDFGGFSFPGASSMRALLLSFSLTPVPDGAVLYTCKVNIAPTAAVGTYPLLCSLDIASDPSGQKVPSTCTDGAVVVSGVCGNHVVESGEACDDGNLVNGDGCDSNCTITGCGNGILTAGEQCDDGNITAGDGCNAVCGSEPGWICPTQGQPCRPICGDGLQVGTEACDDGNLTDGDGCDSNCTPTGCGNGIVTAGEQCDDGNTIDGDGCDSNCTLTPRCGNGVVETGEECDDGGTCIGGGNAGTACSNESDCAGNGVCVGGVHAGTACAGDAACPGGSCMHCVPHGGDGCAANCTMESDVPFELVRGILNGLTIQPGTSGVSVASDLLSLPLPLTGSEVLTIGKERNGIIPLVVKVASIIQPGVAISTIACACIRGAADRTCGGTVWEADGMPSTDCTPGITAGDSECTSAGKPPCTFVYGPGNTASGEVGCAGLDGINLFHEQDSSGCGGLGCPPVVQLSGLGGPGSARINQSLYITAVFASCTGSNPSTYGPDGVFCTADDPTGGIISVLGTSMAVTGTATAVVHNANGVAGSDLGPVSTVGAPFSCSALARGSAAHAGIVTAYTYVHLPTIGDAALTAQFFATGGICGNGVVETGEECDDHNLVDGDGCDSNCTLTGCGNGVLTAGEQCDDGNFVVGDGCDTSCVTEPGWKCLTPGVPCAFCGNGKVEYGEQCDDGNLIDGDGCDSNCTITYCGNGIVTAGEQCDDGNFTDGDGCDSNCTPTGCGNGILTAGEQCDDGNLTAGDGCDATCVTEPGWKCSEPGFPCAFCGNGIVELSEQCDDDNLVDGDGCDSNCTFTYCGNGIVTAGEQCDDGNFTDGDGCDSNCTPTGCGNGIISAAEECDDGNLMAGDGCDASCQVECHGTCVEGAPLVPRCSSCTAQICDADPYCCEELWDDICVDETDSVCNLSCSVCGNGVVEAGEECDDGNTADDDGCSSTCQRELDHFQCYKGRTLAAQPPIPPVTVVDAFASFTARVGALHDLCTPTDQNNEHPGVVAHPYHLESYSILPEKPRLLQRALGLRNRTVVNQFGALHLDVIWPTRLLVPTAKSLKERPAAPVSPTIDTFTCYKVKRSRSAADFVAVLNVTVADQFGPATVTVGRPQHLCMPANKNDETPGAQTHKELLLCHRITGGFTPIGRVYTDNQFGPEVFYPRFRHELCVPSVLLP